MKQVILLFAVFAAFFSMADFALADEPTLLFASPPPESDSLAKKKERTFSDVLALSRRTYAELCLIQKEASQRVWKNDEGLTPQQVCDSLGTNAAKLFAAHGKLTDLIISLSAYDGVSPDIALPSFAFTLNTNGTVTILTTPYTP